MNRRDVTDFATDDSTRDRPIAALATFATLRSSQACSPPRLLLSAASTSEAQNFAQLGRGTSHA